MSSFIEQKEVKEDDCAICGETLKDTTKSVYKLPDCGHMFHTNCLDDLCNYTIKDRNREFKCPLCRAPFDPVDVCNSVYAFKEKLLADPEKYLPKEVLDIYNKQELQEGGGKNKRKSKLNTKKQPKLKKGKKSNKQNKTKKEKKSIKKSIKNKKRRMKRQ